MRASGLACCRSIEAARREPEYAVPKFITPSIMVVITYAHSGIKHLALVSGLKSRTMSPLAFRTELTTVGDIRTPQLANTV